MFLLLWGCACACAWLWLWLWWLSLIIRLILLLFWLCADSIEVIRNGARGPASDVFSLGLIAYYLFSHGGHAYGDRVCYGL